MCFLSVRRIAEFPFSGTFRRIFGYAVRLDLLSVHPESEPVLVDRNVGARNKNNAADIRTFQQ